MKIGCSRMTDEELEQNFYEDQTKNYEFDPTTLVKVVLENKELGLALLQIPLAMVNHWSNPPLEWIANPFIAGWYWMKTPTNKISIISIDNEYLQNLHEDKITGFLYAGPLTPPK